MKKAELRKIYTEKKAELSPTEVENLSHVIFEQFTENFAVKPGQTAHCYLSIAARNEVDTVRFIRFFFENNVRVFVPKIQGNKMISVEIRPESEFIKNKWGISEPISNTGESMRDFNFVITPLLYCDALGNRVGYGKGFYDAFFSGISAESKKIGLGFFPPREVISDSWQGDVPLDYLVTPTEVLSFGGASNATK